MSVNRCWSKIPSKLLLRLNMDIPERTNNVPSFLSQNSENCGNDKPKFGDEWEQFTGDQQKTAVQQRVTTNNNDIKENETTNNLPKFGDAWERFENDLAKTETPQEELSAKNQSKTDVTLESIRRSVQSFEDFAKLRLRAVALQGIYHVNAKEDKYVCEISDICQLSDNVLVITDNRNKSIKKLGAHYDVNTYLKLPDHPFGVCKVDMTQVAVTLVKHKKVQFVSVKKKMALKKSFGVKDFCRGITCNEELFFICCGGSSSFDAEESEGQGYIAIYSLSGTYLSTFRKGISSPRYVCISNDSTRIIISDQYNGIIILDTDGRLVSHISHGESSCPTGVCCLTKEHICVAYHSRNEILSFDETGNCKQLLVQRKEGLFAPRAVCYDIHRSRLVVSTMLGDDTIKVFHLRLANE